MYMFNKKNLFYLIPAFFLFSCQTNEEEPSTGIKESEAVDETPSSETEEPTEEVTDSSSSFQSEMGEEAAPAGQSQAVMPEGIPPLAGDYKHILVNHCANGSTTRAVAIAYLHENAMNTPPDQQPSGEFQVPCEVHYFKNNEWTKEAWANHTASHCPYIGGLIAGRLSRGGYDCQGPIPLVEEPVHEDSTATMTSDDEGMSSEVVEENGADSASTTEESEAEGVVLEEETDAEVSSDAETETSEEEEEEEFEDL